MQPEEFRHEIRSIIREEIQSFCRTRPDSTQNFNRYNVSFFNKISVYFFLTVCQYLTNWIFTNISASRTDARKVDVADDHMSLKSKEWLYHLFIFYASAGLLIHRLFARVGHENGWYRIDKSTQPSNDVCKAIWSPRTQSRLFLEWGQSRTTQGKQWVAKCTANISWKCWITS